MNLDRRALKYSSKQREALEQGCQTQFLEGRSPAEFSSNPAPTHILCSFHLSMKDLISWIKCV